MAIDCRITRMEIHGYWDERFAGLREEFQRNFTERDDVGASFAASVEGELVVDMWAGSRDQARTLPWEEDTLVCVYSSTKIMTALAALVLYDRGELDFDDPVTKYWPEFGQNGKESTLVRHFMGHTAGLIGFGEPLTQDQLFDWDHVIGVLERQAPGWEPGTQCAYHAITQGFLVGEIVRRISGVSLGTFFRSAIGEPLEADFHIGLNPANFSRAADLLPGAELELDLVPEGQGDQNGGIPNVMPPVANGEGWRKAELPAVNGHGNARAMVRAQTPVANGGSAFGVDLLQPGTIEQIFREQGEVMGLGVTHGIGYGVKGLFSALMPEGSKASFWGGLGGSIVLLDHTHRTCVAYAMNQMSLNLLGDRRAASLTKRFYEAMA